MARDRCNCYFSFWASFCPFTPLTAQKNQNFKKMKKRPGDIIILHIVPEIWCTTDRRTDEKSDIQRQVPHLKIKNTCIGDIRCLLGLEFVKENLQTKQLVSLLYYIYPSKNCAFVLILLQSFRLEDQMKIHHQIELSFKGTL